MGTGEEAEASLSHAEAWKLPAPASTASGLLSAALGKAFAGGTQALNSPATREALRQGVGTAWKEYSAKIVGGTGAFLKGTADEVREELLESGMTHFMTELSKGRSPQEATASFLEGLPEMTGTAGALGGSVQTAKHVKDRLQARPPGSAPGPGTAPAPAQPHSSAPVTTTNGTPSGQPPPPSNPEDHLRAPETLPPPAVLEQQDQRWRQSQQQQQQPPQPQNSTPPAQSQQQPAPPSSALPGSSSDKPPSTTINNGQPPSTSPSDQPQQTTANNGQPSPTSPPTLTPHQAHEILQAHAQNPDAPLSDHDAQRLDQARKTRAAAIKTNLGRKLEVTGKPLPPAEAKALADANDTLSQPSPGNTNANPTADTHADPNGNRNTNGRNDTNTTDGGRNNSTSPNGNPNAVGLPARHQQRQSPSPGSGSGKQPSTTVNNGQPPSTSAASGQPPSTSPSGQPSQTTANNGKPPPTSSGRPSGPPLDVEGSRRLIANLMARPEAARQHPTVQADLAQAQVVVAAADGQSAQTQNATQFPSDSPLHGRHDQCPAPEAAKITSQLHDAEPGDANNARPSGSRSKDEWEGLLKSWQKPSPVRAEDVLSWKPSHPISHELRKNMTDAAQALLDMLPEDVAKSLGKVDIEVVASLRKGVPAQYIPDRNAIVFSHQQMGGHNPLQVRKLMWHEVAHWLFDKSGEANAHSHLKAWRAKLEQHWIERTRGEPVATEPVEKWRFIRDGWISDYVGRLYPGEPIGLELPAVYLEEAAAGGSRLAWLGRHHPHAQETFDIILSIFQK